MNTLVEPGAELELLFTGTAWGEGPAWLPATRRLRWSDIPNDRILEYDAATACTTVHRSGVEFVNGRTLDLEQRVVQCSHGLRRIEREHDGVVTPVVERWAGGRFNSPNDVVVAADGAIWFTDPPYGIHESGREGHPGASDYGACFVFRHDEATGETKPVITDARRGHEAVERGQARRLRPGAAETRRARPDRARRDLDDQEALRRRVQLPALPVQHRGHLLQQGPLRPERVQRAPPPTASR